MMKSWYFAPSASYSPIVPPGSTRLAQQMIRNHLRDWYDSSGSNCAVLSFTGGGAGASAFFSGAEPQPINGAQLDRTGNDSRPAHQILLAVASRSPYICS